MSAPTAPPDTTTQGLVDLLTRIGDARLTFQVLHPVVAGQLAIAVWVNQMDVVAAREAFQAEHRPFVSCECPAAKGEACPLSQDECNAREAERRAARNG